MEPMTHCFVWTSEHVTSIRNALEEVQKERKLTFSEQIIWDSLSKAMDTEIDAGLNVIQTEEHLKGIE